MSMPLPFQQASLEDLDARMECVIAQIDAVEALSATTGSWLRYSYRVFRIFLKETGARADFLSGDVRAQMRVMEAWVAWLRARDKARATINGYWRAMRMLCGRIAREDGVVNPFALLRAPHPGHARLRCLTPDAATQVLVFAQNDDRNPPLVRHRNSAIVALMLLAGLRKAETLRLQVTDVDLENRLVRVRAGKGQHGGKPRTVPMTTQLHAICSIYAAARRELTEEKVPKVQYPEFLVGNRLGKPAVDITVRRIFRRISDATGIHVTSHMLRHTFCTLISRAGIPDRLAREAMGHADFKTLARYQHVYEGELAAEMGKLTLDL